MKRVDVAYVLLYDEQESKVLMVKNKGEQSSYYTLPGGAVEPGETLVEGAIREVKEETGLEVEVNGIVGIHEAFFKARGHHAVFFILEGNGLVEKLKFLILMKLKKWYGWTWNWRKDTSVFRKQRIYSKEYIHFLHK